MSSSCPSCALLYHDPDSLALPYIYSITSNRYIVDMVGTPYTSKPNLINAADGTHGPDRRKNHTLNVYSPVKSLARMLNRDIQNSDTDINTPLIRFIVVEPTAVNHVICIGRCKKVACSCFSRIHQSQNDFIMFNTSDEKTS